MSFVAAAVGGGAVVAGVAGAIGADRAAKTQAGATREAIDEQRREFDIGQANLKPFRDLAIPALGQLGAGLQPGGEFNKPFNFDITQDPGYQFRLSQGTTAIENSGAARGMQLSSANLKDLLRFGQDYASGEFNQAFNRDLATKNQRFSELTGVAGLGLGATTTGVQAGNQTAGSIGQSIIGAGNATAAGQVGVANAIGGAAGGVGNAFLLSSILGKQPTTTNPAAGGALDLTGQGVG